MAIRDALSRRASSRMFEAAPLELQQLADLLWCGLGVNRHPGMELMLRVPRQRTR